jgi:LacI family transcriptional regulator
VARLAGVSVAVVSYVINRGPKKVSPATEQRVLAAIAQTGYRPDPVAQALASGRARTLGLIVPDITNPFFARLAREIQNAAGDQTVMLLGDSAGDERSERALLASQAERKVAAIILGAATDRPELSAAPAGVPVVVVDRGAAAAGPRVTVDHRAGALAACQHLIWHGRQTLACLAGPAGISTADLRVDGWREACGQAGIATGRLIRADFSKQAGYRAAEELLAAPSPPEAVFISDDQQAVGFLRAAAEAGWDVPQRCAIVAFNGTEEAAYVTPPLTAVTQPVPRIAEEVMKLIAANLAAPGGPRANAQVVLPCGLEIRRSCGCPAPGGAGR